jgi:hypothetical protein
MPQLTAGDRAAQRPLAFSAGIQPSGVPAYDTIPSWYALGLQDKIIRPPSSGSWPSGHGPAGDGGMVSDVSGSSG